MLKTHTMEEVSPSLDGEEVTVAGNVSEIRDLGGIRFVVLRDGTGTLQITSKEENNAQVFEQIDDLAREYCVQVVGTVHKSDQSPGGREVHPSELTVLSEAETQLPLDTTGEIDVGMDTRLDWRSLDLRREKTKAVFEVEEALIDGMVEHLQSRNFSRIFTPCLLGVASEGGSEIFPVAYYNQEAFLRQDPQLHRELAIAGNYEGVFDLGPSWRAEKSHTSRHLSEHRGLAVEMAYIEDETDPMELQEDLVIAGFEKVKEECGNALDVLDVEVEIPERPFPVLEFPEIYDILEERGKDIEYGTEPDREGETVLTEYVKEEYGSEIFFMNKFPFEEKGIFYAMKSDDPEWARSVDMVYRGTELSTGGQREHRYDQIIEQVEELGMNQSDVEWYTKFLKYGVPPHGGFNIGIERITMKLLGLDNIRDAALFPRDPNRLVP